MLPVLQIGPLAIQLPGLLLLVGLWAGLSLAERYAPRRGVQANDLYNLVFAALIGGVVGARLFYVLTYPAAFASNLASIVSLNPGLLDPLGGIAAGSLVGLFFAQRKGLAFWPTLDALTPFFAVMMIALAMAHLAGGNAFGMPSELPWSIELWGMRRHPAQLYEALLAGLGLLLLWPGRKRWLNQRSGIYFLAFTAYSAGARLFLEAFRGDSRILPGGLRLAQIIAWVELAFSLWGIQRLGKNIPSEKLNLSE
jgi:phosphatidylglycerol---prolipoprotein diacylglyceryl transferase